MFGESSSEDSDDDDCSMHCRGHKKKPHDGHHHEPDGASGSGSAGGSGEKLKNLIQYKNCTLGCFENQKICRYFSLSHIFSDISIHLWFYNC